MAEVAAPDLGSARRFNMYTPGSSVTPNLQRTPRLPKTPLSRRLTASRRAVQEGAEVEKHDYKALLMKQWKVYSLSPLYNFQHSKTSFTKYARSLDVALSQEKCSGLYADSFSQEKSSFSVYEGLNFNDNDTKAVQIQVTGKSVSDKGASIILNAFMICVDLEGSPVTGNLIGHFIYYPVILISGNKSRSETLLTWLEQHFDCHSAPYSFSDNDLHWMLASWSIQDAPKKGYPVLLQYSLSGVCDGISTIDCKFDATFCKGLWERMFGGSSERETINEMEVNQFVTALEQHLEYTMHIVFSKLSLSEVGTSVAFVSNQGKLKLFSSSGVLPALRLICEIVKDKFMQIGYTLTRDKIC